MTFIRYLRHVLCALMLLGLTPAQAAVDPATLTLPGGEALGLSATAVYSLAFFVFWAAAAAACALTVLLAREAEEANAEPLAGP